MQSLRKTVVFLINTRKNKNEKEKKSKIFPMKDLKFRLNRYFC